MRRTKELLQLIAELQLPHTLWMKGHDDYHIIVPNARLAIRLSDRDYLSVHYNGCKPETLCFLARPATTAGDRYEDCTPERARDILVESLIKREAYVRLEAVRMKAATFGLRYGSSSNLNN